MLTTDRRRSYGAIRGNPRNIGRRYDVVVGLAAPRHVRSSP